MDELCQKVVFADNNFVAPMNKFILITMSYVTWHRICFRMVIRGKIITTIKGRVSCRGITDIFQLSERPGILYQKSYSA
jgi:hypothetical protein